MSEQIIGAEDKGSWLRVAVGICARGEWSAATAVSLLDMTMHFMKGCAGELRIIPMNGFIVPEMRSRIWSEAELWKATHILYVDADMGFPDDSLLRLLRHGKPVVGVNYPRKSFPYIPTAYGDDGEEIGPIYTRDNSTGLHKVKHMGFGLTLIEMSVFDQLFGNTPEEIAAQDLIREFVGANRDKIPSHMANNLTAEKPTFFHFDSVAGGTKWITEDVYFARRCAQKGIEMFIDHDLSKQIRHVGQFSYQNYNSVACEKATVETWASGTVGRKQAADQANRPDKPTNHKSVTDFGPLIRPNNPTLKALRESMNVV